MHTADLDAARAAADHVFRNQPGVGASVMGLIAQIFPHQHTVPKDYFTLSGKEAERVDAEIERHVRARELKIKAFHDFTFGHDTNALRIPRADAGQYSEAYRFQLFWMGTLGADDTFRRAATYSLLANIKLEDEGHFERKETLQ